MTLEKRVFSFWFGPTMTEQRELAYAKIQDEFERHNICHILITEENLYDYTTEDPLHESFPHLSATHKTDYLRCYFMHHVGGGYTDIKPIDGNWHDAFNAINDTVYASGYREPNKECIARIPNEDIYRTLCENYHNIIGCCNFIFQKNTPITKEWFNQVTRILDEKTPDLLKFPARHCREGFQDGYDSNYQYPIEWTEILGNILHPLVYKYRENIDYNCPSVITSHAYR